MKLLFDENLSPKLVAFFAGSQHVRELGLKGHADEDIWLGIGNCTRAELLNLIQRHERAILVFETSPESVLILS